MVAGSVLAGPADVWHKVAPDEPALAGVHGGAGCRVGARHESHDQAKKRLCALGFSTEAEAGKKKGAGPPMVVGRDWRQTGAQPGLSTKVSLTLSLLLLLPAGVELRESVAAELPFFFCRQAPAAFCLRVFLKKY